MVSIGWVGMGDEHADNDSLPIKLEDIEELKSNWRFSVPVPLNPGYSTQAYHVYYQLYLGTTPGKDRSGGDIALVMYDSAFYRQPTFSETMVTISGLKMESKNVGSGGYGPFEIMVNTSTTPDQNGVVEIRNFDIKAAIDYMIQKGTYHGGLYLNQVSAAFEVMTLRDGSLTTHDLSFVVKAKNKDRIYTPPWAPPEWRPQ
jgi:hypothetical protein